MPVPMCDSLDDLLGGASDRLALAADGKSGAIIERVMVDGRPHILKIQRRSNDWIMRALGDEEFWAWQLWSSGVIDRLPGSINPAVVGMARYRDGGEQALAILMDDVGDWLVPDGDDPVDLEFQQRVLASMADLHATYWDADADAALLGVAERVLFFSPHVLERFERDAEPPIPVVMARQGWSRLAELAPEAAALTGRLHTDVSPLVDAMAATPSTLLHGDWKLANLGIDAEGRTLLLDWALPGVGPACWEIAWYLALNRARLPGSKELAIATYRASLERAGVDTAGWWDAQIALCLLGVMVVFGWEKALGPDDELSWWVQAALDACRFLG